ncbi:hypothetical protein BOX15_Mlig010833g1 [Macrostomum lignano]|uniref:ANK_REP_REGION domain-containing protein n=1 Tax=Macrostomum lignano TaxID=282301 RepID=A0A267EDQ1_9PLAT|nr:hypothetical protein BOX15_Mlig010833g1 [Macrostomum lignano]
MIQNSRHGFDEHDVRLYQPHYIHRLCQDNDTKALTRTLASDKTGVNLRDQNDMTPLQLTVVTADPPYLDSLMARLIQNGADVDARVTSNGNTALHLAILYSKESNAELSVPILLHEGASPNIRNHLGKTPFDYALANGYRRLAELLASVEDDPSLARTIDPYMWSPQAAAAVKATPEELRAAIRSGDLSKAGTLMRQAAQLAYHTSCVPLHWAVTESPKQKQMLQQLLDNEADPQQVDEQGETAITLAIKAMNHDQEMLRSIYLLLLAGVPKGHRNSEGQDALSLARQLGYTDVEELLLTGRNPDAAPAKKHVTIVVPPPPPSTQRAPPPKKDKEPPPPPPPPKQTPREPPPKRSGGDPNAFTGPYHRLHEIAMQKTGSTQMAKDMEQLFAANPGLNPDIVTNDDVGDTALHIVVRDQKMKAIEFLLEKNATVDVKNKQRETPLILSRNGPWGYDSNIEAMLMQANKRQLAEKKQRVKAAAAAAAATSKLNATSKDASDRRKPTDDPVNRFTGEYHRLHELVMQNKPGAKIAEEVEAMFQAHPGLNPDLQTNDDIGDTALHMAVRDQRPAVIRCLLSHDATVSIRNKKKETPLTLSRDGPWGKDQEIEDMLLEANKKQIAAKRSAAN